MSTQSIMVTTLYLHFFFEIHYRPEAIVCQNILKVTAKCTSVKHIQQFERANPNLQHNEWLVFIF